MFELRIGDDLTLYAFMNKYGESDDVIDIYKKFRGTDCENKGVLKR